MAVTITDSALEHGACNMLYQVFKVITAYKIHKKNIIKNSDKYKKRF